MRLLEDTKLHDRVISGFAMPPRGDLARILLTIGDDNDDPLKDFDSVLIDDLYAVEINHFSELNIIGEIYWAVIYGPDLPEVFDRLNRGAAVAFP